MPHKKNYRTVLFSCAQPDLLAQLGTAAFGPNPGKLKTVCIPTAANVYAEEKRDWQRDEMRTFEQFGLRLDVFDIEGKSASEVRKKLEDADIIYVTGGNTYFLLEHMQKTDFAAALHKRLAQGALYIGCSAGAVVACPKIDYIGEMDNSALANLKDFTGLGLVNFYLMPHIDHPEYGPKAALCLQNMVESGHYTIGLRDDQAVYVQGHYLEMYG